MAIIKIVPFNPIYCYLKKHYCQSCSGKMHPYWTSSMAYLSDPSADPLDFKDSDGVYSPYGEVFIRHWIEFKCKTCGQHMTEKQLRYLEKSNEKRTE